MRAARRAHRGGHRPARSNHARRTLDEQPGHTRRPRCGSARVQNADTSHLGPECPGIQQIPPQTAGVATFRAQSLDVTAITVYNSGTEVRKAKPDPEEKNRAPAPSTSQHGRQAPTRSTPHKGKSVVRLRHHGQETRPSHQMRHSLDPPAKARDVRPTKWQHVDGTPLTRDPSPRR